MKRRGSTPGTDRSQKIREYDALFPPEEPAVVGIVEEAVGSGAVLRLACGRKNSAQRGLEELDPGEQSAQTLILLGKRISRLVNYEEHFMRLKSLSIIPVVVLSMLAAGTSGAAAAGPETPVNLGSAADFTVLSQSGITDVFKTSIGGNVGTSPITGAAIGLTCGEVDGFIYTVDAAGPLPCSIKDPTRLTAAVGDMQTAYNDAAGRVLPDELNLGAGQIGGLTLAPGLYKWTSNVSISDDVTLAGGPNDVWIFQIAGNLSEASAKNVTLTGGALAKNVFWQTAGAVSIGTTAHFEGTVLSKTMVAMKTKASINGRLLAQTAVTLQMNTLTPPAL